MCIQRGCRISLSCPSHGHISLPSNMSHFLLIPVLQPCAFIEDVAFPFHVHLTAMKAYRAIRRIYLSGPSHTVIMCNQRWCRISISCPSYGHGSLQSNMSHSPFRPISYCSHVHSTRMSHFPFMSISRPWQLTEQYVAFTYHTHPIL